MNCQTGNQSACGVYDSTNVAYEAGSCVVTFFTSDEVNCECSNLMAFDSSSVSTELFLDFAAISVSVADEFLKVLNEARFLNVPVILQNLVVFVTIGPWEPRA